MRFFIIATIACAILFCIAAFSVSWADWNAGGDATAEVDGKVGLFYVEYPQYAVSGGATVPVLDADKYYLQVPQHDNTDVSDYYVMAENEEKRNTNNPEKTVKYVPLYTGDTFNVYQGATKLGIPKDNGSVHLVTFTKPNGSTQQDNIPGTYTVNADGYYNFYFDYKYDPWNMMRVEYAGELNTDDPGDNTGDADPFDTTGYSNPITINFTDCKATFYFKAGADSGTYSYIADLCMHIWSGSTTYLNNTKISSVTGPVVVNAKKNDTSFQLNFNRDWNTQSTGTSFVNFAKEDVNCITVHSEPNTLPVWDKGGAGSGIITTIVAAVPTITGASSFTTEKNGVAKIRHATMHGEYDSGKGGYVYRNYVCVSRQNSAETINDNTIAFIEFGLYGTDGQSALPDDSKNTELVGFTLTRANTDSTGVPTSGVAETSPRIYNYDPNKAGGVKLGDIGPGFWHDDENISGDIIDPDKHMVEHFDDGMYSVLFFGDNAQQYFALDVEIVTKERVPDFALVVNASNANRWQRYEDGFGQPFGFYMGGYINEVWTWDPRITTKFNETVVVEYEYNRVKYNDGNGDYYVKYPTTPIDVTLTVNLTKGSIVKAYMLGASGYRWDGTGDGPTGLDGYDDGEKTTVGRIAYLLPETIIMPDGLDFGYYTGQIQTSANVNISDCNFVIPETGEYTFRYVGTVRQRKNETEGVTEQVDVTTGRLGINQIGDNWKGISNANFVVEKLYVTTAARSGSYTVTFDLNGGTWNGSTTIESQTVAFGNSATDPTTEIIPSNGDKTFIGWYTSDNRLYNFSSVVTSDVALHAKWADAAVTYTINYVLNGGANDESNPTEYLIANGNVVLKAPTPPTGKQFNGWLLGGEDGDLITQITPGTVDRITGNTITLWASFADIQSYTVTFDGNGGAVNGVITMQTDAAGKLASITGVTATRDLYRFVGWFDTPDTTGGTPITSSYVFDDDATVYARWQAEKARIVLYADAWTGDGDTYHIYSYNGSNTAITGDWNSRAQMTYKDGYYFIDVTVIPTDIIFTKDTVSGGNITEKSRCTVKVDNDLKLGETVEYIGSSSNMFGIKFNDGYIFVDGSAWIGTDRPEYISINGGTIKSIDWFGFIEVDMSLSDMTSMNLGKSDNGASITNSWTQNQSTGTVTSGKIYTISWGDGFNLKT
ncbi:MAG: InlB B-repeat-containing protein [Clostridiales bacterium]|nr:InlB B-repeat-containing protein [Clostridiales bacterium]